GKLHATELPPPGAAGMSGELAILATFGDEGLEHGGAGRARREVPPLPLEDAPPHALAVDLRIAPRGFGTRELFERDAGFREQRQRGFLVLIVALHQPQHTDRVVQPPLPALGVLLPQDERARRHARVDGARAVGRTDDAGLAARAGARVAGAPRVEQRDAGAAAAQPEGGPTTERAGADHHHVRLLRHREPALHQGEHAGSPARRGAGREKRAPGDRPHGKLMRALRASRTARRTASRSTAGRLGPHGSSQASSGITPSAARAHSMRRTYPSSGGMNVASAKRSHRPDRRTNLAKLPTRNDSTRALCRSVSAAPMPIKAARAPMVSEYPRKRSSPVMSSLSGWSRIRPAMRRKVTTESSVATLI